MKKKWFLSLGILALLVLAALIYTRPMTLEALCEADVTQCQSVFGYHFRAPQAERDITGARTAALPHIFLHFSKDGRKIQDRKTPLPFGRGVFLSCTQIPAFAGKDTGGPRLVTRSAWFPFPIYGHDRPGSVRCHRIVDQFNQLQRAAKGLCFVGVRPGDGSLPSRVLIVQDLNDEHFVHPTIHLRHFLFRCNPSQISGAPRYSFFFPFVV